MGKIAMRALNDTSPFRKIALGTWGRGGDPSVYATLGLDMSTLLPLMQKWQEQYGVKVTAGHLVGKAIARCLNIRPELNGMIRGGKIFLRDDVTLFFQVNIPGPKGEEISKATLAGTTIENASNKSVIDIARELAQKAQAVRTGKDEQMAKNLAVFKWLPWCLSKLYLNIGSWLIYGLNLDLRKFGLPKDPFGSVMVTNVGSLGVDGAWAPLVPYSRVPLVLTVGRISNKPWVHEDQVVVRPVLEVGVTFDHRMIDGIHASHMVRIFRETFEDPKFMLEG